MNVALFCYGAVGVRQGNETLHCYMKTLLGRMMPLENKPVAELARVNGISEQALQI
jgi:hypothetical protein